MHWRCCRPATSSVHYTTSCKHSLVLLRMGEIIARNRLSWLKLLINSLLLHLVGYLYNWQMVFNSVFKGLKHSHVSRSTKFPTYSSISLQYLMAQPADKGLSTDMSSRLVSLRGHTQQPSTYRSINSRQQLPTKTIISAVNNVPSSTPSTERW